MVNATRYQRIRHVAMALTLFGLLALPVGVGLFLWVETGLEPFTGTALVLVGGAHSKMQAENP